MAKPDLIKWVSSDDPLAISDPGSSKKIAGFLYKEKPPFQFLNWIFNQTFKWFRGLQGNYYDVVIGSATQVTNNEATNIVTELNDTLVPAGTKVFILDGSHTLTANISLTNSNLRIDCESGATLIDLASTYKLSLTGNDVWARLKFNLVPAGIALDVTGLNSYVIANNLTTAKVNATASTTVLTNKLITTDEGVFRTALTLLGSTVMNLGTAQSFTAQKNFLAVALTWGANVSWNLNTQQASKLTLTGATAQLDNPTNMIDGGTYAIKVTQDATGSRILTFGTAYKWPDGLAPDLSVLGANEYLRINFESDGSVMDGVAVGPFS